MATSTAGNLTPATETQLAEHVVEDTAQHAALATEEEDDVTWLTNRLDEHSQKLAALSTLAETRFAELTAVIQANQEQSKTIIEAQTRMIETLTANLTALSESALLKSTQANLGTSSAETVQPVTETVVEVNPEESAEQTPVSQGAGGRKHRVRL